MIIDDKNFISAIDNSMSARCISKKYTIYRNQHNACKHIVNCFNDGTHVPLLVAQCQQGKSGTIIDVIDTLQKQWELDEVNYEIIWLLQMADNSLLKQNSDTLYKSKIIHDTDKTNKHVDVYAMHYSSTHSGKNKLDFDKSVQKRLLIMDECHQGLGKDNKLYHCLKSNGIDLTLPKSDWVDRNTDLLLVSATPFTQILVGEMYRNSLGFYKTINLSESLCYYGIENMYADGRLLQTEKVLQKIDKQWEITEWGKQRLNDFDSFCSINGNKHLVIRIAGQRCDSIKHYIKKNHSNMTVNVYESKMGDENWQDSLDDYLSEEPDKPSVIIIKGALRAGKTLKTTQHIGAWIETSLKPKDSSMLQAIGRLMGNPVGKCTEEEKLCFLNQSVDNKKFYTDYLNGKGSFEGQDTKNNRLKHMDKFPIYCNIKEIERIRNYYKQVVTGEPLRDIPSSPWNCGTNNKDFTFTKEKIFNLVNFNSIEDLKKEAIKYLIENADPSMGFNDIKIKNCSANNYQNIAENVITGAFRDTDDKAVNGKKKVPLYHLDSPSSNKNFIESWNNLDSKYKGQGKYLLRIPEYKISTLSDAIHEDSFYSKINNSGNTDEETDFEELDEQFDIEEEKQSVSIKNIPEIESKPTKKKWWNNLFKKKSFQMDY